MYLRGCKMFSFFVVFILVLFLSLSVNARARELFSKESLTTKNALSISLYLIGCITGSMSHRPLYHCCSKYQVKHLPSHFLKICVQSTNIFKHRRIYKSIYVLCHRYNVKYDVFYAKV